MWSVGSNDRLSSFGHAQFVLQFVLELNDSASVIPLMPEPVQILPTPFGFDEQVIPIMHVLRCNPILLLVRYRFPIAASLERANNHPSMYNGLLSWSVLQ